RAGGRPHRCRARGARWLRPAGRRVAVAEDGGQWWRAAAAVAVDTSVPRDAHPRPARLCAARAATVRAGEAVALAWWSPLQKHQCDASVMSGSSTMTAM